MFAHPALAIAADDTVIAANKAFRSAFELKKAETEKPLALLLDGAFDTPPWQKYLASAREHGRGLFKEELRVRLPGKAEPGARRVSATRLGTGDALTLLVAFEPQ
jgi:hypothetical protein